MKMKLSGARPSLFLYAFVGALLTAASQAAVDISDVTAGLTTAQTNAETILKACVGIWVVFMIFKLVRRSMAKA